MTEVATYVGTAGDSTTQILDKQPWIACLGRYNCTVFGQGELSAQATDALDVFQTSDRGSDNSAPKKILASYLDTREFLQTNSPDAIVQLMRYPTHAPGVALASHRAGVAYIGRCTGDVFRGYTHHHFPRNVAVFGLSNVIGRLPVEIADKMVALGPNMQSALTKRGIDATDVEIIPPIIDLPDRFHPTTNRNSIRTQLGLPQNQTLALYTGRVTRLKGMEFLKDVVEITAKELDITFVVVGDGPYRSQLERKYDDRTMRIVGRVPHNNIDQYYKTADVYIHPSPHEGVPLSILEAQKCGIPVVARRAGDVSFATPNVVDTPAEMACRLIEENYSIERSEPKYFEKTHLFEAFDRLVTGL